MRLVIRFPTKKGTPPTIFSQSQKTQQTQTLHALSKPKCSGSSCPSQAKLCAAPDSIIPCWVSFLVAGARTDAHAGTARRGQATNQPSRGEGRRGHSLLRCVDPPETHGTGGTEPPKYATTGQQCTKHNRVHEATCPVIQYAHTFPLVSRSARSMLQQRNTHVCTSNEQMPSSTQNAAAPSPEGHCN